MPVGGALKLKGGQRVTKDGVVKVIVGLVVPDDEVFFKGIGDKTLYCSAEKEEAKEGRGGG